MTFLCKEHSAASAGVNVLSPAVQMFLCLIHYIWYQFKWNKVKTVLFAEASAADCPPVHLSVRQLDGWAYCPLEPMNEDVPTFVLDPGGGGDKCGEWTRRI